MNAIITKLAKEKHKQIMIKLLLAIFKDDILWKKLIFKWWTALYLFYNLDRFSTDLDFDLISEEVNNEIIILRLNTILSKFGTVKDLRIKKYTIFWLLSYWEIDHNIKIEISKRWLSWDFESKILFWKNVLIMKLADMTANKLIALTNRNKLANRDIYDIYFIFDNNFPINYDLIEKSTWYKYKEFIQITIDFLQKLPKNFNILDWLWLVLSEEKKIFVKKSLIQDTINYLLIELE